MDKLTNLQDTLTTNVNSAVNDQVSKLIEQFVIPSIVITAIILIFYIAKSIHRYRVDRAVFEIRDTLRQMKASGSRAVTENKDSGPDQL